MFNGVYIAGALIMAIIILPQTFSLYQTKVQYALCLHIQHYNNYSQAS